MVEDGTHEEVVQIYEPVGGLVRSVAETMAVDTTEALLRRVTVLEGRERALNAELAELSADISRMREHLHEVGSVPRIDAPVVAPTPLSSVVRTVPAAKEPERSASLGPSEIADASASSEGTFAAEAQRPTDPTDGELASEIEHLASPASFGAERDPDGNDAPPSSEIDDLIQEVVASRERDQGYPGQRSESPADAAVLQAVTEPEEAPSPEHRQTPTSDESKTPTAGGIDDFFVGPDSSRRGRR